MQHRAAAANASRWVGRASIFWPSLSSREFGRSEMGGALWKEFHCQPVSGGEKWVILTNTYKTVSKWPSLADTLDNEIGGKLSAFVGKFRMAMLRRNEHCFLLVGPTARPLMGTEIADLFERLTGVRCLCNVRRKVTLTWALIQQIWT
jgi:hypothetical protein